MTSLTTFWCLYCYLCTYFTPSFGVSTIDFEQLNILRIRLRDYLQSKISENENAHYLQNMFLSSHQNPQGDRHQ